MDVFDTSDTPKRRSKPNVRVNSDKVRPLPPEVLEGAEEQSEFSRWRSKHRPAEAKDFEVELVEPARKESWLKKRLRLFLMIIASVAVFALVFVGVVFYSPLLATQTITVKGASLTDASSIESKLATLEGVPLTRISEQQVTEIVGQKNIVREVTVEAHPPHELVVTLHERVPVAVVQEDKTYLLVDSEGNRLGTVADPKDASLPLIEGGTGVLESQEFETITAVLAALPSSLLQQVEEAKASSASTITLKLKDGSTVIWGTSQDSEVKAKVLLALMSNTPATQGNSTYDVSSPLVPTVK